MITNRSVTRSGTIPVGLLLLGASLCAAAAEPAAEQPDPAVAELTQLSSVVELGAGWVSEDSFKFGEYNGLKDQGAFGVGSFDLRGGARYDSSDTTRWRIMGTNLGLDTRAISAEYGKQGKFRLNIGFDELRRNRSDSYQTPYLGVGGAVLTLPDSWIVPTVPRVNATAPNARGLSGAVATSSALVSGVLTPPSPAQRATSSALIAADLPLFRHYDLYTKRERFEVGGNFLLSRKWELAVTARRENKDGAKPMGSVSRSTGGDISTILADPIDQTTDQLSASVAYHSRANSVQIGYYGSRFSNNIASLTWSNWASPATSMTMSSAPGNQAHQLTLAARHDFTPATRLVVTGGYVRNTQNAAFIVDAFTPLVPAASLDGLVVTKAFNLKLTSRPRRNLSVDLGYKFDERDNRTPVRTFAYYDANDAASGTSIDPAFSAALGVPATPLMDNVNVNASRPYSRRLNELTANADLRLSTTQALRLALGSQNLHRWCEGSWIDCMDAADTKEHSAGLEWRASPNPRVNGRLGYTYTRRTVDAYNENAFLALVPLANVSPSTATGGASAYSFMLQNGWNGYGPAAGYAATTGNMALFFPLNNALANATYQNGNRISELLGMRRYNMADRNRSRVRGSLDWAPGDRLSLQGNLDYHQDKFPDSRYGLIDTRDWALSVDGTYAFSEILSLTVFATHEDQRARSAGNTYVANSGATAVNGKTVVSGGCFATIALRNASNKIDPCLDWSTDMRSRINVFGATIDRKSLLASRLDVGAQLVVTRARTDNAVAGGNYVNNPLAVASAPPDTIASYYIVAAPLPTVATDSLELRVNARYALSSASTLRLQYIYGDLSSNDYAYNGMQIGGLAGVLPSMETAPRYVVHVVAVSYAHRF